VAVHLGTLRALERGADLPLERIERLALPAPAQGEALRLLDRFQRFHVGLELRSRAFLERVLGTDAAPLAGRGAR
jgi:hypothetical protein